jgi:FkbM family methyltransferase
MTSETLHRPEPYRGASDRLAGASSASDLRADLLKHYPGLNIRDGSGIAVVGAAGEGARLATRCREQGIKVMALADDHPSKIGAEIAGYAVVPVAALDGLDRETPIVIASHRVLGATERLRTRGFKTVLPFAALQIMTPDLFAPHMFYDGLIEDLWRNRDRYAHLNGQLADQRSRDVLGAVLAFRQTLDPVMLKPVLDDNDLYAPKNLIEFTDNEVYVDGGSYDGDTIRTFIRHVDNRFERIYAFEPDPVTYRKLTSNFSTEPRVEPINSGLHREKGVLRFKDDGSRGAIFSSDGTIEMPVTTLDDVIGDGRVSYIKMNIEELSAGYELYLRQHDGGIIETVLYALHKD